MVWYLGSLQLKFKIKCFLLFFSGGSLLPCVNYNVTIRDVGIWNFVFLDSSYFTMRLRGISLSRSFLITKKTHFSIFRDVKENDIMTYSSNGTMELDDASLYAAKASEDYKNNTQEIRRKVSRCILFITINVLWLINVTRSSEPAACFSV